MQVKRHFSRLFGSFRKKDSHRSLKTNVLDSLPINRDKQTTSRWELLDHIEDDKNSSQLSKSAVIETSSMQEGDLKSKKSRKDLSTSTTFQEVCVELTRQSSTRISRKIQQGFKKLSNQKELEQFEGSPEQPASMKSPSSPPGSPQLDHNLPHFECSFGKDCSDLSSVVLEINDTINLIHDFKFGMGGIDTDEISKGPSTTSSLPSAFTSAPIGLPDPSQQIINFPVSFHDDTDNAFEGRDRVPMLLNTNKANPDLFLSPEEVTRLTSTKIPSDFVEEIINLSQNEERRATGLFAPEQETDFDPSPGTSVAIRKNIIISTATDSLGESSGSSGFERSTFSSPYSSRPWADEMRVEVEESTHLRSNAANSSSSSKNVLRASGRKLYNKIHSRLHKKGDFETMKSRSKGEREIAEKDFCSFEDAFCTTTTTMNSITQTATTSTSLFQVERNKEKEIKSIHSRDEHDASAKKENLPLPLTRSRSARLSRSLRRAISFPRRRSSFAPLDDFEGDKKDNINKSKKKKREGDLLMNRDDQYSYKTDGDYHVVKAKEEAMKNINAASVEVVQEDDKAEEEGGSSLKRKLSLKV
jgi:hypothetical protein